MDKIDGLKEKSKILKESLLIVSKLAENNLADIESNNFSSKDFDYEELQKLIERAKKIKKNKYFKLF